MTKTEEKENDCCFENISKAERVGRAQYRCPVCKKDLSVAHFYFMQATNPKDE